MTRWMHTGAVVALGAAVASGCDPTEPARAGPDTSADRSHTSADRSHTSADRSHSPKVEEKTPQAAPAVEARNGMVKLAGGSYHLGDTHVSATVATFFMDVTEVTVHAYGKCLDAGK